MKNPSTGLRSRYLSKSTFIVDVYGPAEKVRKYIPDDTFTADQVSW